MKPLLHLSAVVILLVAVPGLCRAFESIDFVTRERAKALGLEFRANPAGPDAVRVTLEFEPKGELRHYTRVELEMYDGGQMLLSSTLREEKDKPGRIVVSFAAARTKLHNISLKVVTQDGEERTGSVIAVKDFVDGAKVR
jgi:hypothetical protein